MSVINILLVDDHQLVIAGFTSLLKDDARVRVISSCKNGAEVLKTLEVITPDLILMDIDMPEMNGLDALHHIRKKNIPVKIIMLTMHREKMLARKCRELGANGYLLKNCDRAELMGAIQKVMEGENCFPSDEQLQPAEQVDILPANAALIRSQITEREIEILQLISDGFSNKEIGDKLFISHRTVDTHRTNLMKKLEVNNIAGLIKKSFELGLVR